MRIALLFFGRINRYDDHYTNIMESIGHEHSIDVFFSCDSEPEAKMLKCVELYKPIAYTNKKIQYTCNLLKYPGRRPETNIHNMICHFINKGRVFALLEEYSIQHAITYDIVMSVRVDTVFLHKIIFEHIDPNTIYIPVGEDWVHPGINDQMAYGGFEAMKKYMSIFTNIIEILEKRQSIPHPENLTYANIKKNALDIKRVHISYHLER